MTIATNERLDDHEESLRAMMEGAMTSVQTAMPGIVVTVHGNNTLDVQPAIKGSIRAQDNTASFNALPLLLNVPVMWQGGGGFTATFPIKPGDECLIVFGSRCIDTWFQSGGVQIPLDPRSHALSDAFALVGLRSTPRALPNVSTTSAQFRSDDGTTYVEIAPAGIVNIIAPGGCNITANTTIAGNLAVTGHSTYSGNLDVTGAVSATQDIVAGKGGNNISVLTHKHTGVQTGGGNTGGPTP